MLFYAYLPIPISVENRVLELKFLLLDLKEFFLTLCLFLKFSSLLFYIEFTLSNAFYLIPFKEMPIAV